MGENPQGHVNRQVPIQLGAAVVGNPGLLTPGLPPGPLACTTVRGRVEERDPKLAVGALHLDWA